MPSRRPPDGANARGKTPTRHLKTPSGRQDMVEKQSVKARAPVTGKTPPTPLDTCNQCSARPTQIVLATTSDWRARREVHFGR